MGATGADEFAEFAAARWTDLQRAAQLWGCTPQEAEDAAQETLINCFVHWEKVRHARNADAYVARILINCLNRGLRQRQRWSLARQALDARAPAAEPVEPRAEVEEALRGLPPDQRSVVVLHNFLDLPVSEVAEVMKVPVGTIKSRLARARDQLSSSLQLLRTAEDLDGDHR